MTPTEQDKELRELVHIVQNADTTYDAMQFIIADRRRVALEARIDELSLLGKTHIWNDAVGDYLETRSAELKAQRNKLKDAEL